jgi:hypothetical protein
MKPCTPQAKESGFRPKKLSTNHMATVRESYRLLMIASVAVVLGLMLIGLIGTNLV